MDGSILEVNHKQLTQVIKACYDSKLPLFIHGAIGIGKSQKVRDVAIDMGINMVDVRISQLDPSDLRGLPKYDGDTTRWLPPNWLPKDKASKGILFLDELNLAPPSIQASCYQLILDRRIGDYVLPEGWSVIGAGNSMDDRANVFAMAGPLKNRLCQVLLKTPGIDEWTEWAAEKKIHPDIIAFLSWKSDYLHTFAKNTDASVFATHRGWGDYVNKLLTHMEKGADEHMLVGCVVGAGISREFLAFRKLHKKLDLNEILKNPKKVREIKEPDIKYCLVSALSSKYTQDSKYLKDVLGVTIEMDAEFGILLGRLMKLGNKSFPTEVQALIRKKDPTAKGFIEKYWKYLTDEDIKESG
jgi:hypothetical protein